MSEGNGTPPNRGGVAGATRGGVVNISRGGVVTGKSGGMDPKQAIEITKKQLEAKRQLNELRKQKITMAKFAEFANDNNSRLLQFSVRIESMYLTLCNMFPGFEKEAKEAEGRILHWRQLVHEMENSGMNLKQMRDKMVEWNSDKKNPTINATCFRPDFIEKTFNVQNPDATLTAEEKAQLMFELGFVEEYIKSRVGTDMAPAPLEAEEGAKEAQDDPSEGAGEPLVS